MAFSLRTVRHIPSDYLAGIYRTVRPVFISMCKVLAFSGLILPYRPTEGRNIPVRLIGIDSNVQSVPKGLSGHIPADPDESNIPVIRLRLVTPRSTTFNPQQQ